MTQLLKLTLLKLTRIFKFHLIAHVNTGMLSHVNKEREKYKSHKKTQGINSSYVC